MCGQNKTASTTHVFTSYVDLVNRIFKRWKSPKWKENDLIQRREQTSHFKDMVVSNLGPYQTSSIRTSKFRMLSHIIQDLKDMGGIAYIHGGLYEKAHKIFKDAYKQTSKRHDTVTDESIRRSDIRKSCLELFTKTDLKLPFNCTAQLLILNKTCRLVKSEMFASIFELQSSNQQSYHTQKKRSFSESIGSTPFSVKLTKIYRKEVIDIFIVLIRNELHKIVLKALHWIIQIYNFLPLYIFMVIRFLPLAILR